MDKLLDEIELSDMPETKPDTPEVIKKLQYLPVGSLEGEYDSNDDDSSTYDPFESTSRINTIKALKEARDKFKVLKDKVELINGFSDDMERNIQKMRRDMKITLQIQYESWDEVNKVLKEAVENPRVPDELKKEIEEIFEDKEYMNQDEKEIPEQAGLMVKDEEEKNDENNEKVEDKFDHMEGVWNMLASSKDMVVSPPNYNVNMQKNPHWMNRPVVSWDVLDKSRVKCEKWMENNSDNFNF